MLANFRRVLCCVAIGSFLGLWSVAAGAVEWRSRIDLTNEQNQALVDEWGPQGWAPIYSKANVHDGRRTFDVVFLKMETPWEYRAGEGEAAYEKLNRELTGKGYKLVSDMTYEFEGRKLHDAIWHK